MFSTFTHAQLNNPNNLPPCPTVDYSKNKHAGVGGRTEKWNNCWGRYVLELDDARKGDIYEGEFINGLPKGLANFYYLASSQYKGDLYFGDFNNGFDGFGTYIHANGDTYIGDYKDDKRNGKGTLTYANGDKYVGDFKERLPNGQGMYKFARGDTYIGEFKDGKFNGQGIFKFNNGRLQAGFWADNKFIREAKVNLPNLNNNIATNTDRSDIDRERQQLAEERRRLDNEKRQRQQAVSSQRINLQVTNSQPNSDGLFFIDIKTNADTASLLINGEEQGGKIDGNYKIKKVARIGQDTKFTIVATDINNNTESITITVARQAVSPSSNQSASLKPENIKRATPRDAVAIIIGIQNYKRVSKADFANNDAKEFYEYAIRGMGIKPENIKLLLDEEADEIEIVKAFQNWLPLQVTKNKTDVFVFYSGHGLPSEDGQSLYFLPYGVDKQFLSRTAIGQKDVVSALLASKPKSVTMFIDSCYSGLSRTGETLLASARPISLKSKDIGYPPEFTVISASSPDQISSSSLELQHGIFSFYLMKGMEGDADINKDGKITAGEMQQYVSDKVQRQAMSMNRKQEPQLIGDANRVLVGR
jgi:hypothetical protein